MRLENTAIEISMFVFGRVDAYYVKIIVEILKELYSIP